MAVPVVTDATPMDADVMLDSADASVAPSDAGGAAPHDGPAQHTPSPRESAKLPTAQTDPPGPPTASAPESPALDFTALPRALESAYSAYDVDAAIRPTRIAVSEVWRRRAQPALLAAPTESTMGASEQAREKQKAFDLLDALSRSGALAFEAASLHVLVAATHQFDRSLMGTVISDSVNPIEKLERSSLIIASTIHDAPPTALLHGEHRERVSKFSAGALLIKATPLAASHK
uniref:Uncharacterized protein n=1 Tax=Calcidiscus leptoporus TaxID=127549 RepID=A0A7S0IRH1_9EUKA